MEEWAKIPAAMCANLLKNNGKLISSMSKVSEIAKFSGSNIEFCLSDKSNIFKSLICIFW